MADVFLAYDEEDRQLAWQLAEGLSHNRLTVWNPAYIPAEARAETMEREFAAAKFVIVVWSPRSVRSAAITEKAIQARDRSALVSVMFEHTLPPETFWDSPHVDLTGWTGDVSAKKFLKLLRKIQTPTAELTTPPSDESVDVVRAVPEVLSPPARPAMPPPASDRSRATVFLCYRREDTPDAAGRLYDRLARAYGSKRVFMDIDSVPLGVNFITHINQQLQGCAAVLVIIGRTWTAITDAEGNRRLDDPADHVRVEVAIALKQGVPVIPILVQNASMPRSAELPEDIRELAFHNGMKLSPEFWKAGVEKLIKELDRVMKPSHQESIHSLESENAALRKAKDDAILVAFDPDVYPLCQEDSVKRIVPVHVPGRPASETKAIDVNQRVFRIYVENRVKAVLEGVKVHLDHFEPSRPSLNDLPLHIMHDNPADNHSFKREFTLGIGAHEHIDVVFQDDQDKVARVFHVVQGVDQIVSPGEYRIIISVRAKDVEPRYFKFVFHSTTKHDELTFSSRN